MFRLSPKYISSLDTVSLKRMLTTASPSGGLSVLGDGSILPKEDPGEQAQVLDVLPGLLSAENIVSILVCLRFVIQVTAAVAAEMTQVLPASLEDSLTEEGSRLTKTLHLMKILHLMNSLPRTKSPTRKLRPRCQTQYKRRLPRQRDQLQCLHQRIRHQQVRYQQARHQ